MTSSLGVDAAGDPCTNVAEIRGYCLLSCGDALYLIMLSHGHALCLIMMTIHHYWYGPGGPGGEGGARRQAVGCRERGKAGQQV